TSANAGKVVVICAQRINLNYSGYICAVVPEIDNHNAEWSHGEVVKLLQSQAINKNFCYATSVRWWAYSKSRNFGYLKHL
ncbi:MAG: glycoside hydrolase family 19 protein, partial [Candidatus Atribacteria bacterium]|nr:glycoside hydrolase family 19 protein [Candidatus Atribacteria bacterium]